MSSADNCIVANHAKELIDLCRAGRVSRDLPRFLRQPEVESEKLCLIALRLFARLGGRSEHQLY